MHLQLLPEKPKACANDPKPPRLTLLDPDSDDDEEADDEWPEESLLKKLKRDERPEPLLPPDQPREVQAVEFACGCVGAGMPGEAGAAMPGEAAGAQVCLPISV